MLCSTMICSYKRPDGLEKAIRSILSRCETPREVEILVRFSEADPDSIAQSGRFTALGEALRSTVRVFTGPHLGGYQDIGLHFTTLARETRGKWVHIFDDDMTLEGRRPWDALLRQAPERHLVLCERYTLGASHYDRGSCDGSGIGWWVPRDCWREYGEETIGFPPDLWMRQLLVTQNQWPIHHLRGYTLNHQWMRPKDGDR